MLDYVSDHFRRIEFRCRCGDCIHSKIPAVDSVLLTALVDLRSHFMLPVDITSAWRCENYNKIVGGAEGSRHIYGIAVDLKVAITNTKQVYDYLDYKYPGKYGIGLYDGWVHFDVRSGFGARW